MRLLFASLSALLVLVLFLPVVCVAGEDEPGSCQSMAGIGMPGSAEHGDAWSIPVLVVAALVFLLIWRARRRSGHTTEDP